MAADETEHRCRMHWQVAVPGCRGQRATSPRPSPPGAHTILLLSSSRQSCHQPMPSWHVSCGSHTSTSIEFLL